MLRTARSLAASFALGAALLAIPAVAPPSALGAGPLPACRLDDIMTAPNDYDSWKTTLVDWILTVGPAYKPPDLVSISDAGVTGGGQIRQVAFDDLVAMANAAAKAGTPLGNVSSYRSYNTQKSLFNGYVKGYGFNRAITFSARPGHSEHQLGITIDFAPAGKSVFVSEEVGAGKWLSKNAWKFGWLMSYPRGKRALTCYQYEPWHYRYFGRDLAARIHASGLTTREYLWANFTTAVVPPTSPSPGSSLQPPPSTAPGSPAPSPTGATSSPASPAASATTTPSPPATQLARPPAAPAGTWLGLQPPVVIVAFLLIAGSILTLAMRRSRRQRR